MVVSNMVCYLQAYKLSIECIITSMIRYFFVLDPQLTPCFDVLLPIVLDSFILLVSLLFIGMTLERLTVLTDPSASLKVIILQVYQS
ncbi:MAG: hypothetical protein Ta2E_01750 [Mycoplasmoidaceae bacterium]|nr:MAG: hypothetical protein Ta2E_01750 [Mycoplasmoidaceae bacterium]